LTIPERPPGSAGDGVEPAGQAGSVPQVTDPTDADVPFTADGLPAQPPDGLPAQPPDGLPAQPPDGLPAQPLDELGGWSLARVAEFAAQAHAGQVDKAGRPYIEHPVRVARLLAERGEPPLRQALGLLHDTVEDTAVTLDRLAELGLPARVVAGVDALTKRPDELREEYYARVRVDADALPVKLADIDDNSGPQRLGLLDEATRQRLTARYAHAREVLTGSKSMGAG
jgi:hypothetical protein